MLPTDASVRLKPTSSKRQREGSAGGGASNKRARRSKSASRPEAVPLPPSEDEMDLDVESSSDSESESGSDSGESNSSESSSSSDSSDASSSSSSSSSDSDSDSDSSDSSSAESPPAPQHIPPGHGKASTHERNARRRKARKARLAAEEAEAGGADTKPGAAPAPAAPEATASATPVTPLLPVPRVMANRNKKRGFLKDMQAGMRTVFDDEEEAQAQTEDAAASSSDSSSSSSESEAPSPAKAPAPVPTSAPTQTAKATPTPTVPPPTAPAPSLPATPIRVTQPLHPQRAKFAPPSERAVPTNVFVSSKQFPFVKDQQRKGQDARRGGKQQVNGHGGGGGQQRERELPYDVPYDFSQGLPYEEEEEAPASPPAWARKGSRSRDASTPSVPQASTAAEPEPEADTALWDRVDAAFDTLPEYRASTKLAPGTVIAWREVAIDFTTFTPEVKLLLARVRSANPAAVTLERMTHPALVNPEEEEDAPPALEMFAPGALQAAGRRVVPADWA